MLTPASKPLYFELQPCWPAPGENDFPAATAALWIEENALRIRWTVRDRLKTFRSEVHADGGPVWQDSCVEIFLACLDGSGDYCNLEFNSKACCLAARGPDRQQRTPFSPEHYSRVQRLLLPLDTRTPAVIFWELEALIPRDLLGADKDLRQLPLCGNIYKCGDKTDFPHYLSAFPIPTPRPDFHRPEYFQRIHPEIRQ